MRENLPRPFIGGVSCRRMSRMGGRTDRHTPCHCGKQEYLAGQFHAADSSLTVA